MARSGNGEMDYHDRLDEAARAAWEAFGFGPDDVDLVELHDATSAEELYALESLGFFEPGEAGPATLAGDTDLGGSGRHRQPERRAGRSGPPAGGHRHAQVVELATQLRGRAGHRQVEGARLGVAVNTGGRHRGRRGVRGHPRRRRPGR